VLGAEVIAVDSGDDEDDGFEYDSVLFLALVSASCSAGFPTDFVRRMLPIITTKSRNQTTVTTDSEIVSFGCFGVDDRVAAGVIGVMDSAPPKLQKSASCFVFDEESLVRSQTEVINSVARTVRLAGKGHENGLVSHAPSRVGVAVLSLG
jgi:hypothetical protein